MASRRVEKPLRLTAVSGVLWLAATAVLPGVGAEGAGFYDPDGKALPFGSYEEVEEFLASADIVWKEKLPAGTNKQKRKVLLEKEGSRAHAILRTSYEIKDSPGGGFVDSYLSELAAYELAKLLGLDNVPPVVRRKGGSLQIWIEKATTDAARRQAGEEPADPESFEQQVMDMRVFDNLIANTDRNPGNIIIDANGKVWFIDHTRSFAGQTELKYPDQLEGCSPQLWQRLQGVSDQDIRDAVGSYVKTYLQELLLRRKLLIEELARRMADAGEAELRAADSSR
jgi:hypothetical protein